MKTSSAIEENKKTIGGYDGYNVRDAVHTLKRRKRLNPTLSI